MSIVQADTSNGRIAKRRKLSHSSDEYGASDDRSERVNESGSESEVDMDTVTSIQAPKTATEVKADAMSVLSVQPTGGINRSSTLSLQLNELVSEATPNYDTRLSGVLPSLDRLKELIKAIPDQDGLSVLDAEKAAEGIAIPFHRPRPGKDTKYKFAYKSPESISVRGPLPQRLEIKGQQSIILAVEMPASLFQNKDYLNYRAFHKRVFYLACIASALKKNAQSEFDIVFEYEDGVELLPALRATKKTDSATDIGTHTFRCLITPVFPSRLFSVDKTTPNRSCIRASAGADYALESPTPHYNSCIQSLASTKTYDDLIRSMIKRCSSFADACRMGQIWLRQRGFSGEVTMGGFGHWEWTVVCALLLSTGGHKGQPLFSDRYSSLQLFKAMLQVLAGRDLCEPMLLNTNDLRLPASKTPIFYDGNTGSNILYKMTSWSYQVLRHQAQLSQTSVNSKNEDNFDATFITRVAEPLLLYDEVLFVTFPNIGGERLGDRQRDLESMYETLQRGFGDRITLLNLQTSAAPNWSINKAQPTQKNNTSVEVLLLTNSDTITRLVDHGPQADEQEAAAEFRKFWGEKSELRRFKDGTISESLVWSPDTPVTLQIVRHLLLTHFKLPPSSVSCQCHNIEDTVLEQESNIRPEDSFRLINAKLQELTSMLHQLDGLPLPIRSISPGNPALRSASLNNPLLPKTAEAVDVIIQFDSSARWPDSLPAIQHTKIAFLVKLGDVISAQDRGLKTRVGLENTDSASSGYSNTSYLDIIFPSPGSGLSPICFRVRIHHDREGHLLQTALADKSLHGSIRDSMTTALAAYKREYLATPLHTTTIRALCTRFSPLSITIRLLKKWTSSHLLLRAIPSPILEILAAQTFLHPAPWSVPGSSTTAFLRCLYLLSHWDWATTPLIIDLSLSQDMSDAARADLHTRFHAWHKLDPSMNNVTWFVGTNLDATGTVWTQGATPPKVVAARACALARAAMDIIKSKGTSMQISDWESLFVSPLQDFDFLIHLKGSVVRGGKKKSGSKSNNEMVKFKNLQVQSELDIDQIGYDPVELFVRDLEHAFGRAAMFFYDGDGGRVIAGLWRPNALDRKEWRVRLGYSSMPVATADEKRIDGDGKGACEINKAGILAEIAMLGEGFVREITMK